MPNHPTRGKNIQQVLTSSKDGPANSVQTKGRNETPEKLPGHTMKQWWKSKQEDYITFATYRTVGNFHLEQNFFVFVNWHFKTKF